MAKAAVQFTITVLNEKKKLSYVDKEVYKAEYNRDGKVVSDEYWLDQSIDFEFDFADGFIDNSDEFEKLEPGTYNVFQYGDITAEFSYSPESGKEFDGWIFKPEFTSVTRLPEQE